MERGITKELLTQPYLYYRVHYIQDNKEVTELWVYNSTDMFVKIKPHTSKGLRKYPRFFLKTTIHIRNSSPPSCYR